MGRTPCCFNCVVKVCILNTFPRQSSLKMASSKGLNIVRSFEFVYLDSNTKKFSHQQGSRMRGRSVICLYELLLWIGLGISWSINAATTSNTLNEKIDQLNELASWQRIVVTGEHIRLHPDMSADELEHFLETMGQAALKYEEYSVANHYFLELEALSEDRPDSLTFYTAIKSQGVSAVSPKPNNTGKILIFGGISVGPLLLIHGMEMHWQINSLLLILMLLKKRLLL